MFWIKTNPHHVSTQTPNKHPLKQHQKIFCKVLIYIGLEGIWIMSIGVKEKPSTWEGLNILLQEKNPLLEREFEK
jgi:hypothetical protein